MFGRIFSPLFNTVQRFAPILPVNSFHSMTTVALPSISNAWSFTSVRTKVRCYFPRPNEVMRIRKHGWKTRMSTLNGRRTLMRRILKGRHVLSH